MTFSQRTLAAVALATMALAVSLDAQTVRVRVVDSTTSRPMQGIEMVVISEAGDTVATPKANEQGRFVFNAPPGTYTIRCRCIGHKPAHLTVDVNGDQEVTIRMAPVVVPPQAAVVRDRWVLAGSVGGRGAPRRLPAH